MFQTTPTKLPLPVWAQIVGINPVHFGGVVLDGTGATPNLQTACGQAWFSYEYQDHDRVSREEVARAIAMAEADIEAQIGYRLLPTWEIDERVNVARPYRPELVNIQAEDVRRFPSTVTARWKHLIEAGQRTQTLIGSAAAIIYSDADSDNYDETATVSVSTTVTEESEIAVYYPGKSGDEQWRIRPVQVAIAAGTATITFRRELAVLEEVLVAMPDAGEMTLPNGADDANFLTTVDVYRVWNDPQAQATFVWEPGTGCACENNSDGCQICTGEEQQGCLSIRDPRLGLFAFRPATWDADEEEFTPAAWAMNRAPDALRLWYRAGPRDLTLDDPINTMDRFWAYTVAIYAASMLDRDLCDCSAKAASWHEDLSHISGSEQKERYRIADQDLAFCPFGTRRGAVMAWRRIQQRPGAKLGIGGVYA